MFEQDKRDKYCTNYAIKVCKHVKDQSGFSDYEINLANMFRMD